MSQARTPDEVERRRAFGEVVEPEIEVMLRVARSITGNAADAEDLVQESLVRAFRAIDRFDGRHPRAWLLTIVRNTNANMHRRRRPIAVDDWELIHTSRPAFGAAAAPGAEEAYVVEELEGALEEAIAALGPAFRSALVLVDVHDLSYAEAAVATPLGVMTGRVLGWRLTARPRLVIALLLVPLVLPPFAVAMGLDVVLIRVGLPELVSGVLLLAVMAVPYTAYTSAIGFARTSPKLAAQARALGATERQARVRVVLPAMRGSILVATLLAFLVGWSDYVVTLLVGGGRLVTAPVLLGSAAAGSGNDAMVAAMALSTLLPPVLLVTVVGLRSRPRAVATAVDQVPEPERMRG